VIKESLTFDDVLLVPKYSEVVPVNVKIDTELTKNLNLNVPFLSAAMDTVTESEMAKAMAHEGGIGIIHKNLSIEAQAHEVEKVKKSENGIIYDPVVIGPKNKVKEAERLMGEYRIGGLPVVDGERRLIGIITNRDIRFERNSNIRVEELMTPYEKLFVATGKISIEKAKDILHKNKIEKLPIIDEDRKLLGLITIKDILSVMEHPLAAKDSKGRLLVGAAIGTADGLERADELIKAKADVLVLDSAHAHSKNIMELLKTLKRKYPDVPFIVGNLATAEAAQDLIKAGADALKVGIGPGSICTTRIIAGIGVPQLTAIMNVSEVAKKYNVPVIADGGIRFSGDIVKAIAAGASSVMMGSIFAGTEEAPGEVIIYHGRKFKTYRGMGSLGAMKKGSKDRYFQEDIQDVEKLVPEGVEAMVPYKGRVSETVQQLVGGLRSGMGYIGSKNICELQEKAEFIKITSAGFSESHPHDVTITKEAPNYNISVK
jgi:IMP dehydrogenase